MLIEGNKTITGLISFYLFYMYCKLLLKEYSRYEIIITFTYQLVCIMTDSKKQIVLTALKLFLRNSYKEVSLRDIVNEVGLTKGAFYHYYVSKEQLFEEVVRYFYNHIMITDYRNFPKTSLRDFYEFYLKELQTPHEVDEAEGDTNFFVFISDAAKRLPAFKDIHATQRKKELSAWTEIIDIAKQHKEINSTIASEGLARMFLNISDGISMNRAFSGNSGEDVMKELITDWTNLYELLKK